MRNTFPTSHTVLESDRWKTLSCPGQALYVMLCKLSAQHKNDHGYFFRSVRDLSSDTGMNKDTVTKARNELVDAKLIEAKITKDYLRRKATKYRINRFKQLKNTVLNRRT